ncbi:hypothetical protein [Rhizobium mongolense]|uniref:Uncharacterized protein n=2 Tax=Rhizobium mongolense TaxID=57676 RepID=A0ABR6ILY4_9HYPH|nr:hypothetical protein [Rhizobium mongolense]MBB4228896.1 hypothetical protein [Rhizobium mongolense]TVZ63535.1 hypothetical protein BCL32_3687 [Rhizobium mongolense USDA 1844]
MIGAIIESWCFEDIVRLSGYRNVVSTNYPPTALIHDGASDEKVTTDGVAAYYISQSGLSLQDVERAQQLLERLYALGDWAAGEIVERHRRDQERHDSGYYELKPRLTVPQMLVRRFVKKDPGSSLVSISVGTSMPVASFGSDRRRTLPRRHSC